MADAEIIPLGTRGRPGRGAGAAKPSRSSRDLAGGARRRPSGSGTSDPGPDTGPGDDAPPPAGGPGVEGPTPPVEATPPGPGSDGPPAGMAGPAQQRPGRTTPVDEPVADPPPAAGAETEPSTAQPATSWPRARLPGVPVTDLVAAVTGAAREVFGDSWERELAELLAFLRRRVTGDYVVDEYGLDAEVKDRFLLAAIRPLAEKWFRVEVRGLENLPADGGALVVSNHSGTVPLDGLVTTYVVRKHTGRHLRPLGADLIFRLPFVGELARKSGATLACTEDAERMLSGGELVGVWPEGFKGVGKPYSERYKLQRFGRGGFVAAAVAAGVPIVPCSVVGAEEIYPMIGNVPALARLLGLPYVPITPFFPWLGPLGMVPLPSKWVIEFGEPIRTDSYDAQAADDPMLVFDITDQVREAIQQNLYTLLMQRRSVFG